MSAGEPPMYQGGPLLRSRGLRTNRSPFEQTNHAIHLGEVALDLIQGGAYAKLARSHRQPGGVSAGLAISGRRRTIVRNHEPISLNASSLRPSDRRLVRSWRMPLLQVKVLNRY